MMKKLKITPKLTLLFIIFSGILLLALSIPAYIIARNALRAAAVAERLSSAVEKEDALNSWVNDHTHTLEDIASQQALRAAIETYMSTSPDSTDSIAAHDLILANLKTWAGENHRFFSLQVINPQNGQILISTEASDVGKFKEEEPFFLNGLRGSYVQNPQYDFALGRVIMVSAAPVTAISNQSVVAVLAAPLNMDAMNAIFEQRTGLHKTDDTFLVNNSSLFVTQPHLISDPAVLQRGLHTEAVTLCLEHNSGEIESTDYRDVPAIIVYRWIDQRQLCLISKIDQQEAYLPARQLGNSMFLIGGLVLLVGSIAALFLSRSIAKPVLELTKGAIQVGSGNLKYRIEETRGDEIGILGNEFNNMAAAVDEKESKLRQLTAELEQKVIERTRALSESEERYRILAETSPDMIFVIDRNDCVQFVNERAASQFGKTPEQVTGKKRSELFPPAIAETQALNIQQVLKTGRMLSSESPITFPEGQIWLDTQLVALRNQVGEITSVMGISRDISERKHTEARILRLNSELEEKVAERTAELQDSIE